MKAFLRPQSALMKIAQSFGLESLAWSFRRLHCPVPQSALVLEVGSGGNPYPRANVLLDAYESTSERHWVPLKVDRPLVMGFVEHLPFKDKSFDFIVASHVLEHSKDPERFLQELMRVGKAGYIEVPDAFMERINPYPDHRLEVTVRNGKLLIRIKSGAHQDPELVELYEAHAKKYVTQELMTKRPFAFHVRYYWQDTIDYQILNPEQKNHARFEKSELSSAPEPIQTPTFKMRCLEVLRQVLSQTGRNRSFKLLPYLQCPSCLNGADLIQKSNGDAGALECGQCHAQYLVKSGVPVMYSQADASKQKG